MLEIKQMLKRQSKYISFLLSLYLIGWALTPFQPVFLGLIIGTGLSFFNMFLLVRRMGKFSKAIDEGKKTRSLGMLSRMAAAVFGVALALEFPEQIHLISVVIGLMTSYIVIMIDFLISTIQIGSNKKER
ncbi:ATP synthase subunit I [Niallia sp. NCCP-28]|uniref:ATP synthase subunit I n=1 Tax=Niallia sp. NCCP-28 TaxID=2934712 RepID=UPI00207FD22D|nr:ATP synthase subunit I [Niallia sp. NCCP-28]GKU83671.1 ATP synthase protein I [Niallia sp. NCCP-28]